MATLRAIVEALRAASERREPVVLASVVRVVGSSYGGVGARMLVRVDGDRVGLVSGGCLESDLAAHAHRVHDTGVAELVTYDTRSDDDAVWGLALGCNGLIEVLLEPLQPEAARAVGALLAAALEGAEPSVLATLLASGTAVSASTPRALLGTALEHGDWDPAVRLAAETHRAGAVAAGRRGLVAECAGSLVALEVVQPLVRLVVCGSGPDAVPVTRFAVQLGWDVTVVDHRPVSHARPERFAGARVVECADPLRLADRLALPSSAAAVVMSHHFARDTDYVQALLASDVRYIGVLGPRSRTERIIAELASRGFAPADAEARLHGPVGLDVGGEGPEAIALAIVAEVAAVSHGRRGGSLRERASGAARGTIPAFAGPRSTQTPTGDTMASDRTDKNKDKGTSTQKKLDDLYELIDGIEVCLFTTRRADGQLVTRPMQVQERTSGTDMWFVTDIEANKLDELATDPHVNCGFYHGRTREWVSVAGTAILTQDRALIEGLYKPDWKLWFPEESETRNGGPGDPRIALILVEAQSVHYFKSTRSAPMALFEMAKAFVTGREPKLGEERVLGTREIGKAQRNAQEQPLR